MGCAASKVDQTAARAQKGSWVCLQNVDMCGQGDVDGVGDWKAEGKSVEDLRRIAEERGHMAFSIDPSGRHFRHCAFKRFDFQLTAAHCTPSPGYTNEIHIFTPDGAAQRKGSAAGDGALAGELASAAWEGNLSKVRSLLDRGAPPNTEAFHGFSNGHHSALNGAARNGHAAIVSLLLEQPVKPDIESRCQWPWKVTPLQQAGFHGRAECAKILLRHGASITSRSGLGCGNKTAKEIAQKMRMGQWQDLVAAIEAQEGSGGGGGVTLDEVAGNPASFTLILSGHHDHPACNGRYQYDGHENGRPKFSKPGGTPKVFWTGHSWDCLWGGYSPEAPVNTPVPPFHGYTKDKGGCDIKVVYERVGGGGGDASGQPPARPPGPLEGGPKPKLVLVEQSDARRLALANAAAIRNGQQAPLALAPPLQGYAICKDFEERRVAFDEWEYTALAVGPAAHAVTCALNGGQLVEGASHGVVTPSMLQLHEGNHYDFVWHKHRHPARLHEEAATHGAPLDLVVHPDGSVSPEQAPHLRLGLEFEVPLIEAAVPVVVQGQPADVNIAMGQMQVAQAVGASSSSAMPPLIEAAELFKKQLEIDGGSLVEVVDATCDALGVNTKGLPVKEKAEACWKILHG